MIGNLIFGGLNAKMRDIDPDIRQMAINDLNNAIEAGKMTTAMTKEEESEIVGNLMAIITKDPSTSVKEAAVRCVELLATHLGFADPAQGRRMLEGLTQCLIRDRNEEASEMCATTICILLRAAAVDNNNNNTILNKNVKIPGWETGDAFYLSTVEALTAAAGTDDQARGRLMDVLDLLVQLFPERYEGSRSPMPTVLPYLDSEKVALRRKAVRIVGDYYSHAPTLSATTDTARDTELSDLVERVLLPKCASNPGAAPVSREKLCGYIRCIGSLRAPHGIIRHVPKIVDALVAVIGAAGDEALIEEGDAYINVREACFNALEALYTTGKTYPPLREAALLQHSERLAAVCLEFVKYDPNRMDNDEDEEMGMDGDEYEDEDDVFDAEEFDELNNDSSWKVRRAAVRCLGAVLAVQQQQEVVGGTNRGITETGVTALTERVKKEDDECVTLSILDVLKSVVAGKCPDKLICTVRDACVNLFVTETQRGESSTKKRDSRVKEDCLSLLRGLLLRSEGSSSSSSEVVAAGIFGTSFVPNLISSFGSSADGVTNEYRAGILSFVGALFRAAAATAGAITARNSADLVRLVVAAVDGESHPSTVLEAVKCAATIVAAVTSSSSSTDDDSAARVTEDVGACFARVLRRKGHALPPEATRIAAECLGTIVSAAGSPSQPSPSRDALLAALVEATDDETTLLPALRALRTAAPAIIASQTAGPAQVVPRLLRSVAKLDRQAKQAALQCLDALFAENATPPPSLVAFAPQVAAAAGDLIEDADMHQSSAALQLAARTARIPECLPALENRVAPRAIALCQSQFMQPEALERLCGFFSAYSAAQRTDKNALFSLVGLLIKAAAKHSSGAKRSAAIANNMAAAITAALVSASAAGKLSVDEELLLVSGSILSLLAATPNGGHEQLELGLVLLGAIGRVLDLSSLPLSISELLAQDDSVREAAVTAIGRLCAGAPAHFVPAVLAAIATADSDATSASGAKYRLVHALGTFVAEGSPAAVTPHLPELLRTLDACVGTSADGKSGGLVKAVSECYGRLLLAGPAAMAATLPVLEQKVRDGQEVALRAVHYALYRSEGRDDFNSLMRAHMHNFLGPIGRTDAMAAEQDVKASNSLRREALHTLNAAVRNAFPVVRDALAEVLPGVFEACVPVEALVTRTKVGPYELVVDEGIDTRKAAFACLHSVLLQSGGDGDWNGSAFIPSLLAACAKGLCDTNPGVQVLTCPILTRYLLANNGLRDATTLPALNGVMSPLKAALEKLQRQQQSEETRELTTNLLDIVALIKEHAKHNPYCCTLIKEHVPDYIGLLEYTEKQFKELFKDACLNVK